MGRAERIVRLMEHLVLTGQVTTAQGARVAGERVSKRMIVADLRAIEREWSRLRRVEDGKESRWVVDPTGRVETRELLDRVALDIGREHIRFLDETRLAHPARTETRRGGWKAEGAERKLYFHHEPARSYRAHTEELSDFLDALFQDLQLTVRFRTGEGTDRQLDRHTVLSLVVYRRAVYALLWDGSDPVTPVRVAVDRTVETTVHDEPAQRPVDWDPRVHYADAFGVVVERPPERVVLRFTRKVAAYVRARQWHRSEEHLALADGGVELRMRVTGRELVRWVLEWGPEVEVLAPAWLRDAVVEQLQSALEKYR